MANILDRANKIINERSEEKERMYGPMFNCMERAADIYNAMQLTTSKYISAEDMYKAMVSMKLAREAYHHKEDNLLDAVAYMGSWNDYVESSQKEPSKDEL